MIYLKVAKSILTRTVELVEDLLIKEDYALLNEGLDQVWHRWGFNIDEI